MDPEQRKQLILNAHQDNQNQKIIPLGVEELDLPEFHYFSECDHLFGYWYEMGGDFGWCFNQETLPELIDTLGFSFHELNSEFESLLLKDRVSVQSPHQIKQTFGYL